MPKKDEMETLTVGLLPLFIITVCIVFSFVFTVMMVPLGDIGSDVRMVFIMLLIVSTTIASVVSIIFYIFFARRE